MTDAELVVTIEQAHENIGAIKSWPAHGYLLVAESRQKFLLDQKMIIALAKCLQKERKDAATTIPTAEPPQEAEKDLEGEFSRGAGSHGLQGV